MLYLDTSVIAALLFNEPEYDAVQKTLARSAKDRPCLSAWTGVEIFSAISQRVRMKKLSRAHAMEARRLYEDQFLTNYVMAPISVADYRLARQWLADDALNLRAGDALHLAIATGYHRSSVLTLDKDMLKAAHALGLPARVPG